MSSPIYLLEVSNITINGGNQTLSRITSDFSEQISEPIFDSLHNDCYKESLLSVLDDKNQIISNLTKQLQNQKMQLSYYIKREISQNKIHQLSESCTPQASEESLPLNLAINKFCRQKGIKSKLLLLHERMGRIDYKISNSLRDQEFILRKIVNKLCDFFKFQEMSKSDFRNHFGKFINDPLHVNLFDQLLTATVNLRRNLNGFKICCERVLIVEEERNSIVEQVYSLPAEERINCNYLLGIQMEKAQLENEIKRISQHQATGRQRIKELNVIEKILHNLQWELNSSFLKSEESCVSKMLRKINSEARVLLELTKEQKQRFECELSKTKCPEPNRVLLFINVASGGDKLEKMDLDRYGITTEEEIRFFELIKQEIDSLKKKLREEVEEDVNKLQRDYGMLRAKLSQAVVENNRVKCANKTLQEEVEQLRMQQKNGIQRIRQERDAYKSQVENLQVIREAYAQLVERQPNTSQMEREFLQQIDQRDNKIIDLQKLVAVQIEEIEKLKMKLIDQGDQISILNRFINLTRSNTPKCTKPSDETPKILLHENSLTSTSRLKVHSDPDSCCRKIEKKTNLDNKVRKSDPVFPRYRPYTTGMKKYKGSIKKGIHTQIFNSKMPPELSKQALETKRKLVHSNESVCQSYQATSSCINISSHKTKKLGDVEPVTTKSDMKTDKSSVFNVEIKYENKSVNGSSLFNIEEFQMFKDV